MAIIAILNQKGGVGKTTTAINLSAYLAKQGKSVLLVDADPQGNATSGLGFDKQQLETGMYEVLMGKTPPDKAILETKYDNLFLLPTDAQLASAELDLVGKERREFAMQQALQNLVYDYVIIDCPPSLSLLTVNALSVADLVLIPVQAEYYALEGLGQLLEVMQTVRQHLNPKLELLGVVLTMYDSRTSLSENVNKEVKHYFGDKVFNTVVPRNVRLAEAPSYGRPISEHDKWSKGARAYKQLAKEVQKRVYG